MKRPLSDLAPLILLLSAFACGGRTDLSAFLTGEKEEPSGGSGGDDSSTGGRFENGAGGSLAISTGGAIVGSGGEPNVARCPAGEFDAEPALSELVCKPWRDCPPGKYASSSPSENADRQCSDCPEGTFSIVDNRVECQAWSVCSFGETTSEEGSETSDVECQAPDVFAAVPFNESLEAAGMAATTLGIYLGINLSTGPQPRVVRSALDGSDALSFTVPSQDGGSVTDLTSLGTDIYVAALNGVANGLENRHARIVKFDAAGDQLAVLDLGKQPDEWLLNVLATSDGTDVIVAQQLLPVDCSAGDCAPGVESNLVLSRFDQDLNLITEIRHGMYFNFASIGDLKVSDGRIFLSGELNGNSGVHAFEADGTVSKRYDDFEVGGSIGHVLSPSSDGTVFCLTSEADPVARNLALLDGTVAKLIGQVPLGATDSVLDMVATEQELLLLAYDRSLEVNVFTELDHQGQLLNRRAEEKDFTYLSEMVEAPSGELFVGGVGENGERHVALIRPWER